MPTVRLPSLDPAERDRILDAAALEFGEFGFERASLNRILQATALSKGSFYYYFENKLDLFLTVVERAMAALTDRVLPLLDRSYSECFWDEVAETVAEMWQIALATPEHVVLIQQGMQMAPDPQFQERMHAFAERGLQVTRHMLQQGLELGAVRADVPLELLVQALYGVGEALDTFYFARLDATAPNEIQAIAANYADMFRRIAQP